mgnify:CR=1 FL=1
MKPGDLVQRTHSIEYNGHKWVQDLGLFMGLRTFKGNGVPDYTCAEVMWINERSSTGDIISTIQTDLLEITNESR